MLIIFHTAAAADSDAPESSSSQSDIIIIPPKRKIRKVWLKQSNGGRGGHRKHVTEEKKTENFSITLSFLNLWIESTLDLSVSHNITI